MVQCVAIVNGYSTRAQDSALSVQLTVRHVLVREQAGVAGLGVPVAGTFRPVSALPTTLFLTLPYNKRLLYSLQQPVSSKSSAKDLSNAIFWLLIVALAEAIVAANKAFGR